MIDFHNVTLSDFLVSQAERYPDRPLLTYQNSILTYGELASQAERVAAGMAELGLAPEDRIAAILPNIPDFCVILFAAVRAGLLLVPVNVRRSASEVRARLMKTRPKALVTISASDEEFGIHFLEIGKTLRSEIPDLEHLIMIGDNAPDGAVLYKDLLASSRSLGPLQNGPRNPVVIIHTLGSSGDPRGAVLTHEGVLANSASMADLLQASPEDIFLGAVPFSNTFGLTATLLAGMIAGSNVVCLPRFSPADTLECIEREQVTIFNGVPTMFATVLNHDSFSRRSCQSLRTGIMAGAPCPPELVERVQAEMGCRVLLGYGLTEASPGVTMTHLDDGPITSTRTVGRPLQRVEIKIIDDLGNSLPADEEGELCVRGYNVMLEYWDDKEGTRQVLDAQGWLRTGDLAVIDPDGPVRIVGRKDDVIIRSGFKIFPQTVEMTLRTHPAVKNVAVVGVPDLIYGELICACVIKQTDIEIGADALRIYAAERLPDYSLPDRLLFFQELPRRGSGGINKEYLRQRVQIRGHSWKFGKNINTDEIIPARRCNTSDPRELALYCMEDADKEFVNKMRRGDLIVADANFGCGSSREVAPLTLKAAGVSAVIAKSFGRIFFRNAINIGLTILECPAAVDGIREGDEIEVEPATGTIHNLTSEETYHAVPFPDFLQSIIERGGLLAYVEDRLAGLDTDPEPERIITIRSDQ